MQFLKNIKIKVVVKDNPFLKEQVPYLNRNCNFVNVTNNDWDYESTDLIALVDSDKFTITLSPATNKDYELISVKNAFQYYVGLDFKGTHMTGQLYGSSKIYVLLSTPEICRLTFPDMSLDKTTTLGSALPNVDDDVNEILSVVFGLRSETKFKYEII